MSNRFFRNLKLCGRTLWKKGYKRTLEIETEDLSHSLAGLNLTQFHIVCLLHINLSTAILNCLNQYLRHYNNQMKNIGSLRY